MSVHGNRMKISAHRGASADAPENTLAAIRLAWEQQADGVEIDVRLTQDRQVVVMHDESTRRTTGASRTVGTSRWEDLRALDVGRRKGDRWTGERIPLLEDVLRDKPPGRDLFIEIKCGAEILAPLTAVMAPSFPVHEMAWVAFSAEILVAVRGRFPDHRLFWNIPYRKWKQDLPSGRPVRLYGYRARSRARP